MSSNKGYTNKEYIIGIDLGTTNSCAAILLKEGGASGNAANDVKVIHNAEGGKTTPSVVTYKSDGSTHQHVGEAALRQIVVNPAGTIFGSKRLIGHRFDEPAIQSLITNLPYKVVSHNGDAYIKVGNKEISPQEVGAAVLSEIKKTAENYLGTTVKKAVVTVPAYFNDAQRQATKDAGKIAGLEVIRIINEPTAAALAYGLNSPNRNQTIAVYDLGGGTFDVSILEIADGVIEVKSTGGNTLLGGDDFDARIINFLIKHFKEESKIDLNQERKSGKEDAIMAWQRIKEAAKKAKEALSSAGEFAISLPFLMADQSGTPKHLNFTLSRAALENLTKDLIDSTIDTCKLALKDAGVSVEQINEVILVGGMTRMPRVVAVVEEYFRKKANKSLNPDEVVAVGAAIQASIMQGGTTDILLLDVTPLSLGIETLGGVCTVLIARNTTIPTKKSQVFSTAADSQSEVEIKVYQGERSMASDNKLLGKFSLTGIPPAPRGVPQIEVTFDIDANGIVHASARDKNTNKEQKLSITPQGGLNKSDIERMIKEAEEKSEEDARHKKLIEARNAGESLIYSSEKTMQEHGSKVDDATRAEIEAKISELRNEMASRSGNDGDSDQIESLTKSLQEKMMKVGEAVYKGGTSSTNSSPEENVVDSDYQEVKEDKEDKKE